MNLAALADRLGHRFADPGLLKTALTHRSHSTPHNERLEFLGDGLLNCVVAEALFQRFADLPEGDLSRLRANLVRQEALHKLALELKLGDFLRLGEGELRSGGHQRPSILADALEAIFGAVFRDAGYDTGRTVILNLYQSLLAEVKPGLAQKDPKTRLQEWLQGRKKPLPRAAPPEVEAARRDLETLPYLGLRGTVKGAALVPGGFGP